MADLYSDAERDPSVFDDTSVSLAKLLRRGLEAGDSALHGLAGIVSPAANSPGAQLVAALRSKTGGDQYGEEMARYNEQGHEDALGKMAAGHMDPAELAATFMAPIVKVGPGYTLYHGGPAKIKKIDPEMLQSRDHGYAGKGFYATPQEPYAKTYGEVVSSFEPKQKAEMLRTTYSQRYADPEDVKMIIDHLRSKGPEWDSLVQKLQDPRDGYSLNRNPWVEATNTLAEDKGLLGLEMNGVPASEYPDPETGATLRGTETVVKRPEQLKALKQSKIRQSKPDKGFLAEHNELMDDIEAHDKIENQITEHMNKFEHQFTKFDPSNPDDMELLTKKFHKLFNKGGEIDPETWSDMVVRAVDDFNYMSPEPSVKNDYKSGLLQKYLESKKNYFLPLNSGTKGGMSKTLDKLSELGITPESQGYSLPEWKKLVHSTMESWKKGKK